MENIGKSNNKFQDSLKNPNEHSFFIKESTLEEIMGLIKKLDIKKSADIYRTSSKWIKIAAERIINHLSLTFNCFIEQGIFPEKLKVAFIYPIHKGKSKFGCSNYQPISILPLLSKI